MQLPPLTTIKPQALVLEVSILPILGCRSGGWCFYYKKSSSGGTDCPAGSVYGGDGKSGLWGCKGGELGGRGVRREGHINKGTMSGERKGRGLSSGMEWGIFRG